MIVAGLRRRRKVRGRKMAPDQSRRKFLGAAAGAAAFTIVPRHVLGGPGVVAPSDKITMAVIGTGTQGLREMSSLLPIPEIQVVSVCDPSQYAIGYRDWSAEGLSERPSQAARKAQLGRRHSKGPFRAAGTSEKTSSRPTTRAIGPAAPSKAAPPTPISASCSTRRKTSTRSRS